MIGFYIKSHIFWLILLFLCRDILLQREKKRGGHAMKMRHTTDEGWQWKVDQRLNVINNLCSKNRLKNEPDCLSFWDRYTIQHFSSCFLEIFENTKPQCLCHGLSICHVRLFSDWLSTCLFLWHTCSLVISIECSAVLSSLSSVVQCSSAVCLTDSSESERFASPHVWASSQSSQQMLLWRRVLD